jgi:hypothetical protein
MKLKTEEAQNAQHLAQVKEHSELNVTQRHVELGAAVVKMMQRIYKIGRENGNM